MLDSCLLELPKYIPLVVGRPLPGLHSRTQLVLSRPEALPGQGQEHEDRLLVPEHEGHHPLLLVGPRAVRRRREEPSSAQHHVAWHVQWLEPLPGRVSEHGLRLHGPVLGLAHQACEAAEDRR